ncbi:NAD(P)H-binding protein [Nocardia sp. CA-120079]|uniref:NAD(P)H-binding protein n=1 Tax=Nocardia sp. CA-120079 TaxID=3239974 RepID=UPI003D964FE7
MIVVTGATGNVGRPLVQALAAAGEQVTATSRSITAPDVPEGVRYQQVDLTEPDTLAPVVEEAQALFLLTSADFHAGDGDRLAGVMVIVRRARVRRVVLLSSQGVGTGRHPSVLEDVVKQSGVDWTILRPGGFASNALWWAEMVRTQRMITAPFADVAIPIVDPTDIAQVAAVALREDGHSGQTYTLTGPTPITPRQQAAAIGEALREPVRFVEQNRAEAKTQMMQLMPEPVVERTLDALGTPKPEEQQVNPDIERVLGRPPRTFAEWAARNSAAFK